MHSGVEVCILMDLLFGVVSRVGSGIVVLVGVDVLQVEGAVLGV